MLKNIKFEESKRKNKKYRVTFEYKKDIHTVDFGDKRYQQYKDSTPLKLYSSLNHNDKNRRKNYLARSRGIKNKNGDLTKNNPLGANYWSIRYLW